MNRLEKIIENIIILLTAALITSIIITIFFEFEEFKAEKTQNCVKVFTKEQCMYLEKYQGKGLF